VIVDGDLTLARIVGISRWSGVLCLDDRATRMGGGGLLGVLSCVSAMSLPIAAGPPVRIEPGSDVGSSVAR
jgi:hypothetical protein